MKWEAIKLKCAKNIKAEILETTTLAGQTAIYALKKMQDTGKMNKGYSIPKELAQKAYEEVMSWDIRNADGLADAFPKLVPLFLKSGNYSTELNGDGWEVFEKANVKQYADGGEIPPLNTDNPVVHPLVEIQDAIEFIEANTDYIVNEAPEKETLKGCKNQLMKYNNGGGYDDMGCMTDVEIIEFAKGKGFGIFQNIEYDKLIEDEVKKCEHLECDGTVRVLHHMLDNHHVPHYVFLGTLEMDSKIIPVHYWIGLPDGRLVDYKARMWFGNSAPNGIFYPKDTTAVYVGTPIEMEVSPTVYKLLLHAV